MYLLEIMWTNKIKVTINQSNVSNYVARAIKKLFYLSWAHLQFKYELDFSLTGVSGKINKFNQILYDKYILYKINRNCN